MQDIITSIIPEKQSYAKLKGASNALDMKAICIFVATGFFLDDDTYWQNKKVLRPGTINKLDDSGNLLKSSRHFQWFHNPDQSLSFSDAVDRFGIVLERIIDKQVSDQKVVLPLSGGLDSRTQAVALKALNKNVSSYSYSFKDGYPEHRIGKIIAKNCNFSFKAFTVQPEYLWSSIERLAKINECYSEFTHPRQMAFIDQYKDMGDIFSLGHWGDVLFDDMGVPEDMDFMRQVDFIYKKIVKPSGEQLAEQLWKHFSIEGVFKDYLFERIKTLHLSIDIQNSANARIRAFKSMYWAPRWTSINLNIFRETMPITLPYYHNDMCKFICEVPEDYLAQRKIQIEYIKRKNPDLAKIVWHQQKPFNLNSYQYNKVPYNLPYRIYSKINRMINKTLNSSFIQRNWELQFLGESNQLKLKDHLFKNNLAPKALIAEYLDNFNKGDRVYYAHSMSMLLTLSLWSKLYNHQ